MIDLVFGVVESQSDRGNPMQRCVGMLIFADYV
jgi:hypothetical protein